MRLRRIGNAWLALSAAALAFAACALPEYSTYKVNPSGDGGANAGGAGGAAPGVGGAGGVGVGGAGGAPSACALLSPPDKSPPDVCSPSVAGPMASVDFVNNCATETVTVYWVNDFCTEEFYFHLPPGTGNGVMMASAGDVWRVRDMFTQRLMKEIAPIPEGNSTYTVP